ncbi:MAG TPA: hypothetical protein PLL00_04185 [Bacteroidia bacterium]|jgi:hypothetical protein|nr:hypothetical protein [Bacteroidia bacterium]
MLKLYDPWENIFQSLQDKSRDPELLYYASDIEQSMGFTDDDMETAIERAFQACSTMHITIEDHFKPIFRTDNSHELLNDWKLSSLACYLLIINANPSNSNVAKVQLFFAGKSFNSYQF